MKTKRPLDLYHVMTNLNAAGAIDVILNTGDVVRLTLSDEYCSVISAEFLQDEVSIDFGDEVPCSGVHERVRAAVTNHRGDSVRSTIPTNFSIPESIECVWNGLEYLRERLYDDAELVEQREEQWNDVCTAMAWITEELGYRYDSEGDLVTDAFNPSVNELFDQFKIGE